MKKLLLLIMAIISINASSKEFQVEIDMEKSPAVVKHVPENWVFLMKENDYTFSVNIGEFKKVHSNLLVIYSLVDFDEPRQIQGADIRIDKIYSYGLIDCGKGLFSLLGEIYTDANGVIHKNAVYEEGNYIVNLDAPGTARYEAYALACKTSV